MFFFVRENYLGVAAKERNMSENKSLRNGD